MKYITIMAICTLIISCGSKNQVAFFPTSEVTYLDYTGDILSVRVLGYGVDESTAIQDAQIRAIETLFFRGIPNSNIAKPLIGYNENELKRKHSYYFRDFFTNKKFLSFISETIFIGGQNQKVIATKINKKELKQGLVNAQVVAIDLLINVKPLRKNLEQQSVIKKFGF
ncbi:hypothetical protein [uncultured Polaribacter sp.]|uniref:hypothetical protein n=1 Tax=uncultured Polaribacter sp. TaxID=174711 RepID=UPI00262D7CAB|nr:hypothetical protein [uncultured Polaribacter sp.]